MGGEKCSHRKCITEENFRGKGNCSFTFNRNTILFYYYLHYYKIFNVIHCINNNYNTNIIRLYKESLNI